MAKNKQTGKTEVYPFWSMNDLETARNEESGKHKFIVPIKITYNTHEVCREIIINTVDAETAMHIAIGDFQHNGWIVDTDYQHYKQLKE